MRDLLFKNLTSSDRKRKVIATSEISDNDGIRSIIHRHFICIVKEVDNTAMERPLPQMYIVKERNSKTRTEAFFCRIKNSVYALYRKKVYRISFMHTLKIRLLALPAGTMHYTEENSA